MGRPRTNPYTETKVYVQYYEKDEKYTHMEQCVYAFEHIYKTTRQASSRLKAQAYVDALGKFLPGRLEVTMKTYAVYPQHHLVIN